MNIFCDLDGVLADLELGYKLLVGMEMQEADKFYNYDHAQFWQLPKQTEGFWRNLPLMDGAPELMNELKQIMDLRTYKVFVLSAAVRNYPECSTDKRIWVDTYTPFSMEFTHIVRRSEKQMFATTKGRPNILIDDYDKNIGEWVESGGIGIHHTDVNKTIKDLTDVIMTNEHYAESA